MKNKIITILMIFLLVGTVSAYKFSTVYNPFTSKLDYYSTSNMSGENVTADYFFGNGSQLSGIIGDNSSWNQSYADTLYRADSWDNFTGIPHATPSNGDTTHFSLADEIYDFVIALGYATQSWVNTNPRNWTYLQNYPVACPAGSAITQLNDSITCTAFGDASYQFGNNNFNGSGNMTASNIFGNLIGTWNGSSDYYTSTETDTEITNANTSMKSYVDAQDVIFNTSIKNYADGKFVVNSGGDSLSGQYDFNGGWTSNGLSIIDGDIYAQTGYFYNLTGLDVSTLKINGSILPQVGFDNQFDIGSSALRWKDLYLGGEVFSNGTGDNYFLGKVGVGVIPLSDFHVKSSAVNNLMTRFENSIGNIIGGFGETSLSDGVFTVRNSTGFVKASFQSNANSYILNDNFGIGTTAPSHKLHIKDTQDWIRLEEDGGTTNKKNYDIIGVDDEIRIRAKNDANSFVRDIITLEHDGNVGIGTSSPGDKLEVAGNIVASNLNLKGATTESRSIEIGAGRTGSGYAYIDFIGDTTYSDFGFRIIRNADGANANSEIKHRGTGDLVLNSVEGGDIVLTGGNVGIGTSSPSSPLDVIGEIESSGTHGGLIFGTGSILGGSNYGDVRILTDRFRVYDNAGSNVAMNIDSSGNVGIGTSSPEVKLDVNGSIKSTNLVSSTVSPDVRVYHDVAMYANDAASQVGSMVITLPKGWSNTMMQIEISGYDYTGITGAWKTVVGGYNYITSPAWISYYANSEGSTPFNNIRLGYDTATSRNVIILGTTATTWQFPQIAVTKVVTGYSSSDGWGTGWDINIRASETGLGNIVTPEVTMHGYNGNVGIGTTSPAAKLDIFAKANDASNPGFKLDTLTRTFTDTVFEITGSSGSNGVFIKNDGKVGIGITSPSAKLDVSGTSKFSDTMQWKHYYKSTSSPTEDTVFDALNSWVPNIGDFLACHGQAINNQTSSGITITGIFKRASSIIDIIYISYAGGSTRIIMNDGDATVVASTIEIMSNFDAIT